MAIILSNVIEIVWGGDNYSLVQSVDKNKKT